jgi:nucleotide-binding universal stress UspA family protein
MLRIQKILFPTDFSVCAESAYSHAVHLARRYNAELHVVSAIVRPSDEESSPLSFLQLESDDKTHDMTLGKAGSVERSAADDTEPRTVTVQLHATSPADAVVEYADTHDIDLIVMGTHGRHGVDRILLGSVAEKVVRLTDCPVLTVRQGVETHAQSGLADKILVPFDFSEHSYGALRVARELALAYDAHIDLLHVVQEVVLPNIYGVEPMPIAIPDVEKRAVEALEEVARKALGELPFATHVRLGHPAFDIVKFAETCNSDMIVIATHGLTGVRRLLMGSVTEKIVRMAPCPVFTVRPFGKTIVRPPEAGPSSTRSDVTS